MRRFLLLVLLAIASPLIILPVAPASAETVTALLDAHAKRDVSTPPLAAGTGYVITISGTYSVWGAGQWGPWTGSNAINACPGTVAAQYPMMPSPGATNGAVGLDPEYVFAWPVTSSLCPAGVPKSPPPMRGHNLMMSLDGGANFGIVEPVDSGYQPVSHSYQYLVPGRGLPVIIKLPDTVVGTNPNGMLKVTVEPRPAFKLGFKALADQIPDIVGNPLANEHWGANGDSLQQTTKGLMVWRKADNWTAFTNGSRTWINGPNGMQDRANDDRFDWETAVETNTPAATAVPAGATTFGSPGRQMHAAALL